MFARMYIVITIMLILVSGCAPAPSTDVFEVGVEPAVAADSNQAVKDELQPIMRAVFSGIITDQLALIQYTQAPCTNQDGLGGPPRCTEGVPEGTIMEAFPMVGPEGSFVKPEEMENVLTNFLVKSLYAVYRVTPGSRDEPYYPIGKYAMLFERDLNDIPLPVVLRVMDGKIVRMDFHMGISAADILKEIPVEQIVIRPQEAAAWMEEYK